MPTFDLIDADGFALTDSDGFAVDSDCPGCCGGCATLVPFTECYPQVDAECSGYAGRSLHLCESRVSGCTVIRVDGVCYSAGTPIDAADFTGVIYDGPFDCRGGDCDQQPDCDETPRYIVGVYCPGPTPLADASTKRIIRSCLVRGCAVVDCFIFQPGPGQTLAEIGGTPIVLTSFGVGGTEPGEGSTWFQKCCDIGCAGCTTSDINAWGSSDCTTGPGGTEVVRNCCCHGPVTGNVSGSYVIQFYDGTHPNYTTLTQTITYTFSGNTTSGVTVTATDTLTGVTTTTTNAWAPGSPCDIDSTPPGYLPFSFTPGGGELAETIAVQGSLCATYTTDPEITVTPGVSYAANCGSYNAGGVNVVERIPSAPGGGSRVVQTFTLGTLSLTAPQCGGGCGEVPSMGLFLAEGYW